MIDTTKFINYAARNIPPSQIAAAFGITPGRVTQLLGEPRVQERIQEAKRELALQELETQTTIKLAKRRLLDRIVDLIEHTDSLGEATRAYESLSKIAAPEERPKSSLVTLEIPEFMNAKVSIELSTQNEIIEIDGRSMATLPNTATHKLIKERRNGQEGDNAKT